MAILYGRMASGQPIIYCAYFFLRTLDEIGMLCACACVCVCMSKPAFINIDTTKKSNQPYQQKSKNILVRRHNAALLVVLFCGVKYRQDPSLRVCCIEFVFYILQFTITVELCVYVCTSLFITEIFSVMYVCGLVRI